MTAFNTASNTGSTTFTNAYGTIDLLPSGVSQHAHGFPRTTGWRYWEAYIDDQGGDPARLFVGMHYPPNLYNDGLVYGGDSVLTGYQSGTINPGYPYTPAATSLTARTGDVFMFAVDMTGTGRDHSGNVVDTTLSSGTGTLLTPMTVEVGKNGVWNNQIIHGWSWPAGGWPMRGMPVIIRDSTSASYARVSLRVVTTSFAYAIPSGMVAWDDGPEGANPAVPSIDATVVWDQANSGAGTRVSISGASLYAVAQGTGEFPTIGYAMTIDLKAITGKRYVEFMPGSSTTTYSFDGAANWYLGMMDSTTITLTAFSTFFNAIIYRLGSNFYKHGAAVTSISSANGQAMGGGLTSPHMGGLVIDFDNELAWFYNPNASSGTPAYPFTTPIDAATFSGERAAPYSLGALPYSGGFPVSLSAASIIRIFTATRMDYAHSPQPISLKINPSSAAWGHPFPLPGVRSLNGLSVIEGQGDSWDVVNIPASATYGAGGLMIQPRYSGAAQGAQSKFAGKKYFEIYAEGDASNSGVTWDWSVGLRRAGATTLTWGVNPLLSAVQDDALIAFPSTNNASHKICRYGVTLSWSATVSNGIGTNLVQMSNRILVAVDFDAGNVWFGRLNLQLLQAEWGDGRDPATGVNPHVTFTASTTMRVFMTFGLFNGSPNSATNRYILVQDDNNVVGKPAGFDTWGGTAAVSLTATPSGSVSPTASAILGSRVLWPYGVQT